MFFLVFGAAGAGVAIVLWSFGALDRLERSSLDARFSIRGRQKPPPELVYVAIDDVTFSELGGGRGIQWPFPRSLHARVLDRIAAGRPRAIAYDVQFTEPTVPAQDNALIKAVARAKVVVLATTETLPDGQTRIFGGNDVVRSVGARPASGLLPDDPEGTTRRLPYSVGGLSTLAVVTAERATGRRVDPGAFGAHGAWIDFLGPHGTIPTYSFSRVLAGRVAPSVFRHKIVVVGPSAPTLHDLHATPTDALMPGGEVQANAIATVLRGLPLRSAPAPLDVSLILLLGLLTPALSLRVRPIVSMPVALLAGGALAVGVQVAFDHGTIVSFVYPLAALTISTVAALGVYYVLAAFERARVRDLFARFVPEQVVDEVLARTDDDLRLGGVRVEGTCLFSDIRDFTTKSEKLPAERVVEMLNVYLSEMTEAILAHGGTLVSYLGDGIMAVFGAPIEQPDHADRAFAAACEMLDRLPRVNAWIRDRGISEIAIGIGLNTGPFMSGNVGAEQRLEYTAIGDTINTASRIEGLTKGTPYSLLVADATRAQLVADAAARLEYFDEVEVRGREARLALWGLTTDVEAATTEAPTPL